MFVDPNKSEIARSQKEGALMSTVYPLVFTFHEVIVGNGFVARIDLNGRALLAEDKDDGVWLYGVEPGSVAGGGSDYSAACREFKKSYLSVLFDQAQESPTFEEFKKEVEAFAIAVNGPNQDDWNAALREARKNPTDLDGFATVKAESRPPKVEVSRLEQRTMRPAVNQFDEVGIAQVAA
jgi:hypothetical protein